MNSIDFNLSVTKQFFNFCSITINQQSYQGLKKAGLYVPTAPKNLVISIHD